MTCNWYICAYFFTMNKPNDIPTVSYCAFLRGVNVNGTNMKMKDVCTLFENQGIKSAYSILASGNILFDSEKPKSEIKQILEKELSLHFNYEAFIFIKTKNEIERIIRENPFESDPLFHIYCIITATESQTGNLLNEEIEKIIDTEQEQVLIIGENIYWKVLKGNTLDSKFGKTLAKKNIKNLFTSRNMNTIHKILRKMN